MMKRSDVRMGDVLRLDRRPVNVCADGDYVALGMRSFGRGIFHYETCKGDQLSKLRHFTFPANALAFSNIKAWEGAVAVTSEEDTEAVASSRFLFYVPKGRDVDVRYLRYYFLSFQGLRQIGQASPGSADRNRTLSIKSFEDLEVTVPDIDEQRRVADKLDAALSRIAQFATLRERSIRLTHQHMDSLLRPIEDQVPLSTALRPSSDFVDVDPDDNYRTAGILNRGRGLFHRPVISGSDTKYPRYNKLHTGQFVYSKLFGWEGSLAVVPAEFEGVHVSHEFPTFDIEPSVADIEYMTHLARWSGLHDALKDKGTGMGSRRQRVNVDRLLATTVPLPSLPEQRHIARQLNMVRQATEAGAEQLAQVATLRPVLLNAAFSGQL